MNACRPGSLGSLLALLALIMQVGFGAVLPRSDADAVLAAAAICHADNGGGGEPAAPRMPDCGLCPVCMTVASVAIALPATGPAIPAPRSGALTLLATDPAATPSVLPIRHAARPRAPPIQA